jgi:hypothetical protein
MSNCYTDVALKVKYREDKSQDFEIMGKQIVINVFECGE